MYECFNYMKRTVGGNAYFSFEYYVMDGEGIVHTLTCGNCGAIIEHHVRLDDPEEEEYDGCNVQQ